MAYSAKQGACRESRRGVDARQRESESDDDEAFSGGLHAVNVHFPVHNAVQAERVTVRSEPPQRTMQAVSLAAPVNHPGLPRDRGTPNNMLCLFARDIPRSSNSATQYRSSPSTQSYSIPSKSVCLKQETSPNLCCYVRSSQL